MNIPLCVAHQCFKNLGNADSFAAKDAHQDSMLVHTQMPVVEWPARACHRSDEEGAESYVIELIHCIK